MHICFRFNRFDETDSSTCELVRFQEIGRRVDETSNVLHFEIRSNGFAQREVFQFDYDYDDDCNDNESDRYRGANYVGVWR